VSRGGKTYLLTEMHGLDPSWRPQAAMYDWAFRWGDRARPVGELVEPGTVTEPPTLPAAPVQHGPAAATSPAGRAAGPSAAGPAPDDAQAGPAAAIPGLLDQQGLSPWVGVAALAAAVLLVGVLAARAVTRASRARHH
jgi:D-alanyl-D-alanine carboxypeptidase (penicillin-binding protein 5/6)